MDELACMLYWKNWHIIESNVRLFFSVYIEDKIHFPEMLMHPVYKMYMLNTVWWQAKDFASIRFKYTILFLVEYLFEMGNRRFNAAYNLNAVQV